MDKIPVLEGKRIVLGVTGGIAAYKVATLASQLTQAGAEVDAVMTEAATRFVSPLTFEALTGRPVYTDMWRTSESALPVHVTHVGLAHEADLLVVAPATANSLAKLVTGLADDLLSTLAVAARCPVLLAPAMDVGMWTNAATRSNVATLRARGVVLAGPGEGRMASGLEGEGRLLEPEDLLGHVRLVLGKNGGLAGRRVVVTAGPTREFFDPARFLSNPSSGRQGFALAQAVIDRGAEVTLVTGPTALPTPTGAERVDVTTTRAMQDAVVAAAEAADVLLMAAAPADFRPTSAAEQKIKKERQEVTLPLVRTADILSTVAIRREATGHPKVVVGFAAESENLEANARAKLAAKNLDMIVANDITAADAGFGAETNRVVLLGRDGTKEELPLMSKAAVAEAVLDRVMPLL
jgi:phosphopantothenoylcysteine decarboxylase/phosphopantothenate--cysteine ligase